MLQEEIIKNNYNIVYWGNGNILVEGYWDSFGRQGLHKYYHENGIVCNMGYYLSGVSVGLWFMYYKNGEIKRKEFYS